MYVYTHVYIYICMYLHICMYMYMYIYILPPCLLFFPFLFPQSVLVSFLDQQTPQKAHIHTCDTTHLHV